MNRIPEVRYTKEAREEVVSLARAIGASEAFRRLSIPLSTSADRRRAANAGQLSEVGRHQPAASEAELELAQVKGELPEVKMERDLLKSLRPTSRRSRGEVSGSGATATSLSATAYVPDTERIDQWTLRVARPRAVAARKTGTTPGIAKYASPTDVPA